MASPTENFTDAIKLALKVSCEQVVQQIIADAIKEASGQIEYEIRKAVSPTIMSIYANYELQSDGRILTIKVSLPEAKNKE